MPNRTCTNCNVKKDTSEFHLFIKTNPDKKTYRELWCNDCYDKVFAMEPPYDTRDRLKIKSNIKYKYEVAIKAEIKKDGKVIHTLDGRTTYYSKHPKSKATGLYMIDGKNSFNSEHKIETKRLIPNVCDKILDAMETPKDTIINSKLFDLNNAKVF